MPNPVLARRRFAPWRYLLLARFGGGDRAAPLGSPLAMDVGSLTLTDASNVLSQSGGALVANGTPGAASGVDSGSALARVSGRALLARVPVRTTITAGTPLFGWNAAGASSGSLVHGLDYSSTTAVRIRTGTTTIDTVTLGSAEHALAVIARGTGAFLLARNGTVGPYRLLWVYNATTAAEFAALGLTAAAVNVQVDDLRVVDLPAPWNSDYGIATTRAINPVAGVTPMYPMSPDSILEFSFTYTTGQTYGLDFRRTSSSNTWRAFASAGGALLLQDITAGATTTHLNVASVFTNAVAYRVVVVAEGNVYTLYVNDVLKGTYTDAGSFQTTVTSWVVAFNTDGGMSSAVAWPRTINLPNGA